MSGNLKEFFSSLKSKEKVGIILSMSALGIVLIGAVLLIAFCDAPEHVHQYDCSLELVDGKFNLIGKCEAEDCENPEIFISDVDATLESTKSATCIAKGEIVYSYTYEGAVAKYTEYTDYSGHMLGGVEMDLEKTYVSGEVDGIESDLRCGSSGDGRFTCDNCAKSFTVAFSIPVHKMETFIADYDSAVLPTKSSDGYIYFNCPNENDNCTMKQIKATLPKIVLGKNATLVSAATATEPAYVDYKASVVLFLDKVEVVLDRIEYKD